MYGVSKTVETRDTEEFLGETVGCYRPLLCALGKTQPHVSASRESLDWLEVADLYWGLCLYLASNCAWHYFAQVPQMFFLSSPVKRYQLPGKTFLEVAEAHGDMTCFLGFRLGLVYRQFSTWKSWSQIKGKHSASYVSIRKVPSKQSPWVPGRAVTWRQLFSIPPKQEDGRLSRIKNFKLWGNWGQFWPSLWGGGDLW